MINTVESLRGLYVALGGNITEVANLNTIPELLTEISTVAQAAATELPAVKPADNGKVLTVVNSKWAKADLPTAASDKLGCVKVGSGLAIADGVLSASGGLPAATAADSGKALEVDSNGDWIKSAYSKKQVVFTVTGLTSESNVSVSLPSGLSESDAFQMLNAGNSVVANCSLPGFMAGVPQVVKLNYSGTWKNVQNNSVYLFHDVYFYEDPTQGNARTWKEAIVLITRGSSLSGEVYVKDYTNPAGT